MKKITLMLAVLMLAVLSATITLPASATVDVTENYVMFDLRNYDGTNEIPFGKGSNGNCYYPKGSGVEYPEVYTWGGATIELTNEGAVLNGTKENSGFIIEFDKMPTTFSMAMSRKMNHLAIRIKACVPMENAVFATVSQGNTYKKEHTVNLTGDWQIVSFDMSGKEGWTQVERYTEEVVDEKTGEKKTVNKSRYNPIDFAPWDDNKFSFSGFRIDFPSLSETEKTSYVIDYFAYMEDPTAQLLTGESYDHKAYIKGYDGNLFKPNATMTRAEACTIVTRLIADEENLGDLTTAFTDVPSDAWYFKYVAYLESKGYLGSYSGTFAPNQAITRAEFVELVYNMGLLKSSEQSVAFSDVKEDHPRYNVIVTAAASGLVSGYSDGTFLPDRTITRAQVVKVINTALGRKNIAASFENFTVEGFSDVAVDFWAYTEIIEASVNHSAKFGSDGNEVWSTVYETADYEATEAKIKEVDEKSAALKNEILNTTDDIVVFGTTYYVSNNGNDSNDGKTTATAWKTLSRVNAEPFAEGDAVCFERGGLWRGQLTTKSGVTYAAYLGSDSTKTAKPMIYGSPYNGAGAENWTLVEGTTNLWKFKYQMKDVGTVVFNEGEAHSIKEVPSYIGGKYVMRNDTTKEFNFKTDIKNDLGLFSDNYGMANSACNHYVRCDKGNPGELYTSIEFLTKPNVIAARGSYVIIDNLCVKYGGAHGVGAGSIKGLTVQNCVFEWIGGTIQNYSSGRVTRYGNAIEIYGGCEDYVVEHNYINQAYDAGATHQLSSGGTQACIQKNVLYTRNLFEYCIYSIEYFLGKPNDETTERYQENVVIEDNIMRYAGFGFGEQRPDTGSAAHIKGWDHYNRVTHDFIIRNNVFDRSRHMLIHCGVYTDKTWLPTFEGNTWIQYEKSAETASATLGRYGTVPTSNYAFDLGVRQTMKKNGIEENPQIFFVKRDWLWDLPVG